MLSEEAIEIFNSIELLDRFRVISENFQSDTPLESYSIDRVDVLLEGFG